MRWRYTTDAAYQGRGVYVDGVRVERAERDAETTPSFTADGVHAAGT